MIDGDTRNRIMYDIQGDVPVTESRLIYDEEMLEFREAVEEEYAEALKDCPEAVLDIPAELPAEPLEDSGSNTKTIVDHHNKMAEMHQTKSDSIKSSQRRKQ